MSELVGPSVVNSLQSTVFEDVNMSTGPSYETLAHATQDIKVQKTEIGCSEGEALLVVQRKRFRCEECDYYSAETEERIIRHVARVHRGENPFNCYMCEYSTYNKVLFEEHIRIHQGIKPFKCSHCPYRSASKRNAKKHELIHRPDNPLRCKKCDFIGKNSRALACHSVQHESDETSNIDPLICTECGYQATSTSKLELHITEAHGEGKECGNCKGLFRARQYKSHMKNRKRCNGCSERFCNAGQRKDHVCKGVSKKKWQFVCRICEWRSTMKQKILLHLIHHPEQEVDESVIDISVLRTCGIMK